MELRRVELVLIYYFACLECVRMRVSSVFYQGEYISQTQLSIRTGIAGSVISKLLSSNNNNVDAMLAEVKAREAAKDIRRLRSARMYHLVPDFECKYCGKVKPSKSFGRSGLKCDSCKSRSDTPKHKIRISPHTMSWAQLGATAHKH